MGKEDLRSKYGTLLLGRGERGKVFVKPPGSGVKTVYFFKFEAIRVEPESWQLEWKEEG